MCSLNVETWCNFSQVGKKVNCTLLKCERVKRTHRWCLVLLLSIGGWNVAPICFKDASGLPNSMSKHYQEFEQLSVCNTPIIQLIQNYNQNHWLWYVGHDLLFCNRDSKGFVPSELI